MADELELFKGVTDSDSLIAWQKCAKELALALSVKGEPQENAWNRRNSLAQYQRMAKAENVPTWFLTID